MLSPFHVRKSSHTETWMELTGRLKLRSFHAKTMENVLLAWGKHGWSDPSLPTCPVCSCTTIITPETRTCHFLITPLKHHPISTRAEKGVCALTCVSWDHTPCEGLYFHGAAVLRGITPETHRRDGKQQWAANAHLPTSIKAFFTATSEVFKYTQIKGWKESYNSKKSSRFRKIKANHVLRKRNFLKTKASGWRRSPEVKQKKV